MLNSAKKLSSLAKKNLESIGLLMFDIWAGRQKRLDNNGPDYRLLFAKICYHVATAGDVA
jgi:hypothetical protein